MNTNKSKNKKSIQKFTIHTYYGNKKLTDCMKAVMQDTKMKQ